MARELARILTHLSGKPWAITSQGLDELIALASREPVAIEALARRAAVRSSDAEAVDDGVQRAALADGVEYLRDYGTGRVYGNVAVIRAFGPLIAYASWLEDVCGVTSYETIVADCQAAAAHPAVTACIIEIDGPGGQVTGCSAAAGAIKALAELMPVVAFVAGDACSASYWLASACDHIVVSPTSGLGSLGCCCSIIDRRGQEEKQGIKTWEIISSQTPNKRPDVATDSGRAAIQQIADDTAAVFLAEVAANRGMSLEVVSSPQFGQGAVMVGQRAVDAGLADEVGTFDDVMDELADEEDVVDDGVLGILVAV